MTKEETISNLKAYIDGDTAIGNIIPLRSVLESAIKYLEPSLPSNLDEAAGAYAHEYTVNDNGNGGDDWEDDIKRTFIAAVEWLAGQGASVDGEVIISHGNKTIEHRGRYGIQETTTPGIDVFNVGDKVVVQIRKK